MKLLPAIGSERISSQFNFNYLTCSCALVLSTLLLYVRRYSSSDSQSPTVQDNSHERLDRAGLTRCPEINQLITVIDPITL